MQTESWQIGGVLSVSWELFKRNLLPLLGAVLVFAVIGLLFAGATEVLEWVVRHFQARLLQIMASLATFAIFLLFFAVKVFFAVGFTRMVLKAVRGDTPTLLDLLAELPCFLSGLVASLLIAVGVAFGTLLCIVPGVVLGLAWMFTLFLIVDRGLGPLEALRESWRLTEGERLNLFLWLLACCGLCLAGLAACCIGLFVTYPLCGLGTALIYTNLTERKAL